MTYRPNPVTSAPVAAGLTGAEIVSASQGGRDVAVPLSSLMAYVVAALSGITPVQPPASGVYQRTSDTGGVNGKGVAAVAFSVTSGAGGLPLNYRLRDAVAAGTPVLVGATQALASLVAGTQAVTVSVPAGTSWYFIDWQGGASGAWVLGTQRFAVGDVMAVAGQSLAAFFLSVSGGAGYVDNGTTLAALGIAVPAASSELASYALNPGAAVQNTPPAWATPGDGGFYNAAGAAEYLGRMVALTGVAQAVAGHAVGGSTISQWAVGQAFNTALKANLTAAGGVFRTLLWVQGHEDAKAGTTAGAYQAALGSIMADLAGTFPGLAFKRVVMSIPSLTSTYSTTAAAVQAIRAGAKAYAAGDAGAAYVDALDVALNDGVHPSQAGYVTLADHVYRAATRLAGFRATKLPPSITGGTRAAGSAVVSLTVAQGAGTALVQVGTPVNQFAVFAAGSTSSPLIVSSLAIPDATHINLTLSAAPADAQALDVWVRYPFDTAAAVASGIYDNAVDGDGITRGRQLVAPAGAVTVAAPNSNAAVDFAGVTGLAAWYRPSDSATVVAASGSVSQVQDISGNARHATRAASTKPTLAAGVLNGLPVLAFDGVSQALEMDGLASALAGTTGPHHIFAVARLTGSASNSIYPAFFALQAASPSADYGDGLFAYTNGNNQSWGSARANGSTQAYSDATANGNTAAVGTWAIVEATWDGASATGVAVNGGAFNLTATPNPGAAGAVGYARGRMGVRWTGGGEVRGWPGQIAELAMVSGSVLSGSARTNRLKYLNARYALGLAGLS